MHQREHKLLPLVIAGLLLLPCVFQSLAEVHHSHSFCHLRNWDKVTRHSENTARNEEVRKRKLDAINNA